MQDGTVVRFVRYAALGIGFIFIHKRDCPVPGYHALSGLTSCGIVFDHQASPDVNNIPPFQGLADERPFSITGLHLMLITYLFQVFVLCFRSHLNVLLPLLYKVLKGRYLIDTPILSMKKSLELYKALKGGISCRNNDLKAEECDPNRFAPGKDGRHKSLIY